MLQRPPRHRRRGGRGGGGERGERLLLSYGVNDCEAKVGAIELEKVWASLVPLGQESLCAASELL